MANILYVGNYLKRARTNTSYMFTLAELLRKEGFQLTCTSGKNSQFLRLLDMVWTLIRHGKSADHILIDTYSTKNFYYALIISQICRLFGWEYITLLHGGDLPDRLESHPQLCQLIFKNSRYNIAPSQYMLDAFKAEGYDHLEYIPNAIELENYKFQKKSIDQIKLLWVRGFSKIYNPLLAINVLNDLCQKGYKAELCMVGPDIDGSMLDAKKAAMEKNLKIKFTGKLTKPDWIKLSRHYNVFINTTDIDNTPVSVIEAMALGLPVVSTDVGGLPYLIKDHHDGLLVPKQDKEAMVSAILDLKSDSDLLSEITQNARSKVENFAWSHLRSKWLHLLS